MNQQEYKQLTYDIVPSLKDYFKDKHDKVDVCIVQDTLSQQGNPFQPSALVVGIGYLGTNIYECYQVTNSGDVAEWKFIGNTQVSST